ncbi:MlaE family ABC transporter permease [Leadbettera azotonutricia]|uniref:ABC amino acid transporter, inner membrane subunit n=1 Tax=Leadbettera azotonutricia (strain ATCC BAA-888 / DSM 13862 / ZAS-9) TaxID=545695 RepID=F5YBC4_LEAAZ|nr:ABC transporter permease [Leadbettera azotonutricia]AEF81372.1 ABC amino acid transporter, inner membrane subunit [Leadbettera azotonutricia ZAS-9]
MFRNIIKKLEILGRYFAFVGEVFGGFFKRPFHIALYINEIEHLGVNSAPIILLSGAAMGMIFALQMVSILADFHAEIGVGAAVAIALARELSPVITTLMLIAKNGSAMAAELGTMKVTEQIDALESMSVSPVHYLVLPKVVASIVIYPVLTLLSNVIGSLGAFTISIYLYNVDSAGYTDYLLDFLSPRDVFCGLIKSAVMGIMVATICCFNGLRTIQGAKGVGDSATKAVVISSVAILVADYLLDTIMMGWIYA